MFQTNSMAVVHTALFVVFFVAGIAAEETCAQGVGQCEENYYSVNLLQVGFDHGSLGNYKNLACADDEVACLPSANCTSSMRCTGSICCDYCGSSTGEGHTMCPYYGDQKTLLLQKSTEEKHEAAAHAAEVHGLAACADDEVACLPSANCTSSMRCTGSICCDYCGSSTGEGHTMCPYYGDQKTLLLQNGERKTLLHQKETEEKHKAADHAAEVHDLAA